MFGKKAKEIEYLRTTLKETVEQDDKRIRSLEQANADKDQKLINAQTLIQRAEADRDAQKRRADENYTELSLLKSQMVNAPAVKKGKKP